MSYTTFLCITYILIPMSYKRVIKKRGKTYGPYVYESYRDEKGIVRKRYLGKKQPRINKQKKFLLGVLFLFALSFIFLSYTTNFSFNLLGYAILHNSSADWIGEFNSTLIQGKNITLNWSDSTNTTYIESGTYTSQVIDVDPPVFWSNLTWTNSSPDNTDISMQIRSCNDILCDEETFVGPDNTSLTYFSNFTTLNTTITPKSKYFQYKFFFSTTDTSLTPYLQSVSIDYLEASPPDINFTDPTPLNGSLLNYNSIFVNVSANDTNLETIVIYLYNSTSLINFTNSSTSPLTINFTDLPDGIYYINATANDTAGNLNYTETRQIQIQLNHAPNNPLTLINSTSGSNTTLEDLNCFSVIEDADNNKMNVSVRWYKNQTLNLSLDYNLNYPSGTFFNVTLNNANTTKYDNWSCSISLFDGASYSDWINSSELNILNSFPNVTLTNPDDSSTTTNRTPMFFWQGYDADGDAPTYEINITPYKSGSVFGSDDLRYVINLNLDNYTANPQLRYLYDNGYYYVWKVRANDSEGYGNWSSKRIINISSSIIISMPVSVVNFGEVKLLASNDTTSDSPPPFKIQNNGNALVNITINSTSLWKSVESPNDYYKFKVDNVTGEEGAFNWLKSITSWIQMPTSAVVGIVELNYSTKKSAEVDIYVETPPNEYPGARNTTVTFESQLAE